MRTGANYGRRHVSGRFRPFKAAYAGRVSVLVTTVVPATLVCKHIMVLVSTVWLAHCFKGVSQKLRLRKLRPLEI